MTPTLPPMCAVMCGCRTISIAWLLFAPLVCPADEPPIIYFGVVEPPVVAQKDITVEMPRSPLGGAGPLEGSGLAWIDGSLLLVSDHHEHILINCPISLDTLDVPPPMPLIVVRNEQEMLLDCESIAVRPDARGRPRAYGMCSLSNDKAELPLPRRRHMLRTTLRRTPDGALESVESTVLDLNPVRERVTREFNELGVEPYRTYYADHVGADKNTYRWGNVEGIAFAPAGGDDPPLLCGMRNPLLKGRAIVFVLGGIDAAFDARDVGRITLRDLFTLDLGGRGVSDLSWDPVTRGYLIAAADSNGPKLDNDRPYPPNTLRSALFWWSGHKADAPIRFADVPDMKIEGICRIGSTRFIAIVSDEADESEGRTSHQSVLTVLDFAGVPRPSAAGTVAPKKGKP